MDCVEYSTRTRLAAVAPASDQRRVPQSAGVTDAGGNPLLRQDNFIIEGGLRIVGVEIVGADARTLRSPRPGRGFLALRSKVARRPHRRPAAVRSGAVRRHLLVQGRLPNRFRLRHQVAASRPEPPIRTINYLAKDYEASDASCSTAWRSPYRNGPSAAPPIRRLGAGRDACLWRRHGKLSSGRHRHRSLSLAAGVSVCAAARLVDEGSNAASLSPSTPRQDASGNRSAAAAARDHVVDPSRRRDRREPPPPALHSQRHGARPHRRRRIESYSRPWRTSPPCTATRSLFIVACRPAPRLRM